MLSVVAICKNEIKNIKGFIASWSEVADEIVIVDTGSTDGTLIALHGIEQGGTKLRVFTRPWDNDFSAARNFAAKQALGTWILWADMDDRIDVDSCGEVKRIVAEHGRYSVFGFQIASDIGNGLWHRFMQIRLYPNFPSMLFRGSVHENLEQSIEHMEMRVQQIPEIIIAHLGYATPEIRKAKAVRNLSMLLENHHDKHDAGECSQIGDALYTLEKYQVGIGYFEEAVRLGGDLAKKNLAEKLCIGYLAFGAFEKAMGALQDMSQGSMKYLFWAGEIKRLMGDTFGAMHFYKRVEYGDRDISGRECNGDMLVHMAKKRYAEVEAVCALA